MEKTIFSQLETTALFAGLTANAIERQLEKLPYSIRKVPAKTVFLSANEPLREMVMVLEGRVSAKMTSNVVYGKYTSNMPDGRPAETGYHLGPGFRVF